MNRQPIDETYSNFDYNYIMSDAEKFNSIKKTIKETKAPVKIKKSYNDEKSNIEAFSQLGEESSQVLNDTQPTQREIDELVQLKKQYNHIIDTYNSLLSDSLENTSNYFERIDPSTDTYIGSNISLSNSVIGYVTQQGVFKPYKGETFKKTAGQNNCPTSITNIDVKSENAYDTGSYLNTNPKLLIGTIMKTGQSCGFEGKNVSVDKVLPSTEDQYINCFDNSMKVELLDSTFNFNECKQSAINRGYQYFALKEVNADGIGKCAVTNDIVLNAPLAYYYKKITLWSLKISDDGVSLATISPSGSLVLANFGENSKKNSNSTSVSKDQMSNYIGCYTDTPQRAIPLLNNGVNEYTYTSCMQEAQKQGQQYFALQYLQPSGMAQCGITNNINDARKFGKATNCTTQNQNNMPVTYGAGWTNAIYSVQGYSFYFLILQDDGNMCIYRGSSPQDNQGLVWSSETAGKQKDPNPNYVSTKGKNKQNWISSPNSIHPENESLGGFIKGLMESIITTKDEIRWIGSTDGSIYLILEQDGNLSLNTSEKKDGCNKIGNNMVSTMNANAINSLLYKGYPENVGKIGYVDENSDLWEYPESMIKLGETYQVTHDYNYTDNMDNMDSIHGINTSVEQCKTICNSKSDCAGFTYEKSTQNCNFKKKIPKLKIRQNPGYDVYSRERVANFPSESIDSIQWQNYNKGGNMTPDKKFNDIKFVHEKELTDIREKLKEIANNIEEKTRNLEKKRLTQRQQMELNNISIKSMVNSYNSIEETIKKDMTGREKKEGFINMNRILEESKLSVNQEHLNYAIWTILAIYVGIVLIKVMRN